MQSRYYDPVIGRFINADGYASTGQGILGCNMFAYCGNEPILFLDDSGLLRQPFARFDDVFGYAPDPCEYAESRRYCSMDDAAIAGGSALAQKTHKTDLEYAYGIYFDGNMFYLGECITGKHDGVNVAQCFTNPERIAVATVHSHPYCTGHNGNSFSTQFGGELIGDAKVAFDANVPVYLAAPNGKLLKMEVIQRLGNKYFFDITTVSHYLPVDRTRYNCGEWRDHNA